MRKTLVYLILLIVLAGGVWYIFYANKENIFGNAEGNFTIKDTASIGKIFMAHTNGRTVTLERTPGGWMVNKKYKVLPAPLNTLLTTMYRQQANYPAPTKQYNSIVKSLAVNSIKVEVYNLSGDLMRVFYVGDEADNYEGTYMLMEGAKTPYSVNMPGFVGILTSRYSTDITDWRDRIIFNIDSSEIKSVSVQYIQSPLNSFIIQKPDNGNPTVKLDSSLSNIGQLNLDRANSYLGFFKKVYCEAFTTGAEGMDTVLATVPRRCVIDVVGKNGYVQHLTVFWRPLNRRSKNLETAMPNYPNQFDADKYYAVFNNDRDTAVIQRFVFEKIFRNGYEFYQQPEAPRVNEKRDTQIIKMVHPK